MNNHETIDRRLDQALDHLAAHGHGGKLAPAHRFARRIRDAVRRDRTATVDLDGYPGGGGDGSGIRGNAELTTVEAAANQRAFGRTLPDPHHELTEKALAHILDAAAHLSAAGLTLDALDALADDRPAPGRTEAVCAEPTCEDPAAKGEAGRCEACARWRRRNTNPGDTPPPVPADVIKLRVLKRTQTKVHVTGPLACPDDITAGT